MRIDSNKLSKKTLVFIVDQLRPVPFTDKMVAKMMRAEIIQELIGLKEKMESLEKEIDARKPKISIRSSKKKYADYNKLVKRYNKMGARGTALIKTLTKIETEYPDLKEAKCKNGK